MAAGRSPPSTTSITFVPFGEYLPFEGSREPAWASPRWLRCCPVAMAQGRGRVGWISGPVLGHAFPMICYEAIFPGYIRALDARPDWMVHVTNDAWFGTFSGPWAASGAGKTARRRAGLAGVARRQQRACRPSSTRAAGFSTPWPLGRGRVARYASAAADAADTLCRDGRSSGPVSGHDRGRRYRASGPSQKRGH